MSESKPGPLFRLAKALALQRNSLPFLSQIIEHFCSIRNTVKSSRWGKNCDKRAPPAFRERSRKRAGMQHLEDRSQTARAPRLGGRLVYNCTRMQVEWDPGKARLNARKHGVALADAVAVLENDTALTMRDPFPEDEERWITLGVDAFGRVFSLGAANACV